ncbi:TetR family transcriptional regulator [Haloactinospora alba]|uniref:TetR family transcriptional regulator n=1 Tax=Haloactinospora alba TaxID=405555 RepID=A0A543N8Z9_9ACTN|nr:TetR family transcriptional regulator [Haloactinospora alba]TQN28305.1 TetR family transcriptional regulator [Haloactinospora alba]
MGTRRGPNDPHRRDRIIAATQTVVAERGVAGLTHRAVAKRAGVPLGSTTYYFATLEELLHAALERAAQRYTTLLREWAARFDTTPGPAELADALTDLIADFLGPDREQNIVECELYVAALRRPALREVANRYTTATIEVLSGFTTPARAAALSAALDGLVLHGLTAPESLSRADIATVVEAILLPG